MKESNMRETKSAPYDNIVVVLVVSVLAWPFCFVYNQTFMLMESNGYSMYLMMPIGALLMSVVVFIVVKFSRPVVDRSYYGYALFTFTCMVDVIIGLEIDGHVSGFMNMYLTKGEPYLNSAYGAVLCYSDCLVFLPMYIYMVFKATESGNYRSVALYWSSALSYSLFILLLGAFVGATGPYLCTLLNFPYVVFPLWVMINNLKKTKPSGGVKVSKTIVDYLLALVLLGAMTAIVIKGLTSLNSAGIALTRIYRVFVEPILQQTDPAPFANLQGIVMFFYFAPVYAISIYGLLASHRPTWLEDLTLIHSGAAMQAQIVLIGMIFHWKTPVRYQPASHLKSAVVMFWTFNLLILIAPHLLLWRLRYTKTATIKKSN